LLDRKWISTAQNWGNKPPDFRINISFSHHGLRALDIPWPILDSFPKEFKAGMLTRAEVIGDDGESAPVKWEEIWQDDRVYAWLGLYAKSEKVLKKQVDEVEKLLSENDCDLAGFQDVGHLKPGKKLPERPIEHFGFVDGISNPPIAGMDRDGKYGGGRIDDCGQWDAMAAGEFVLGPYQDEIAERPKAPASDALATNGTFMVYRKLHQDVDLFRQYTQDQAFNLKLDADEIAAKMIGRRKDGSPLIEPNKGAKDNDFLYEDDLHGEQCPLGSHIRRTNPRDTFGFGTKLVNRHRMLRRGFPYGKYVKDGVAADKINPESGQGLIFIALVVSIERQFEFVQQQWVNYGDSLSQGSDKDPLTGNNRPYGQFKIPGDDKRPFRICTKLPRFVTTRGGNYFFLPGIQALHYLASGRRLETRTTPDRVTEQQAQIS
jgi:Dyp-type peroxidase family